MRKARYPHLGPFYSQFFWSCSVLLHSIAGNLHAPRNLWSPCDSAAAFLIRRTSCTVMEVVSRRLTANAACQQQTIIFNKAPALLQLLFSATFLCCMGTHKKAHHWLCHEIHLHTGLLVQNTTAAAADHFLTINKPMGVSFA